MPHYSETLGRSIIIARCASFSFLSALSCYNLFPSVPRLYFIVTILLRKQKLLRKRKFKYFLLGYIIINFFYYIIILMYTSCKKRKRFHGSKNNVMDERLHVFSVEIADENIKSGSRNGEVEMHVGTFTRYFAPCLSGR